MNVAQTQLDETYPSDEDVARGDIRLRTQHAGWYLAIVSNGFAFISGIVSIAFGRGAVLGPTRAQLEQVEVDTRVFDAITPRPTPRVVGMTPRGDKVVRTPRAATSTETYRVAPGAFTRRDPPTAARRGGGGGRGGRGGRGSRGRGRGRDGNGFPGMRALEDPGGAGAGEGGGVDGKSSWEAFKRGFWEAARKRHNNNNTSFSGAAGGAVSDGDGNGSGGVRGREFQAYRVERNARVGRLTGFLSRFTMGGGGGGRDAGGGGGGGEDNGSGLGSVSHHLARNAVVLPPPSSSPGASAPSFSETALRAFGVGDNRTTAPPANRTTTTAATTFEAATNITATGAVTSSSSSSSSHPTQSSASVPPPVPPRRLPPLDLSNLSLRQRAEMAKQTKGSG